MRNFIIKDIEILNRSSEIPTIKTFHDKINLVYSKENTTGKTTFIRSILYALGFDIPNTYEIDFKNYIFTLHYQVGNEIVAIIRNDKKIILDDQTYLLPRDRNEILIKMFKASSKDVLDNLLGVFYFDQERGWDTFTRGKSIGEINFNFQNLFAGFNNVDTSIVDANIKRLELNKKKYRFLLNSIEFESKEASDDNDDLEEIVEEDEETETIYGKISSLRKKLKQIDSDLAIVRRADKQNHDFIKYIESKQLRVKGSNGETIPVKAETICDLNETIGFTENDKNILEYNRQQINNELSYLTAGLNDKDLSLLKKEKSKIDKTIEQLKGISKDNLSNIIEQINKDIKKEEKKRNELLKYNNSWLNRFHKIVHGYLNELGVSYDSDCVMKSRNENISGAITHIYSFVFKLAYIKIYKEKYKIKLPIIVDSPNGREVKQNMVDSLLKILIKDFSDHQIIIASINKYKFIKEDKLIVTNKDIFNTPLGI